MSFRGVIQAAVMMMCVMGALACEQGEPTTTGPIVTTVSGALGPYVDAPANYCTMDLECVIRDCETSCRPFGRWNKKKYLCEAPVDGGICDGYMAVCGEKGRCRRVEAGSVTPSECGPLPSDEGCADKGCLPGMVCDLSGEFGCVPSECGCDPMTGDYFCTDDCGGGVCVPMGMECPDIMCDLECEFGFEVDEAGCPICSCLEEGPDTCGCENDADCVKVVPGCCPCEMGGIEVAVAVACLDSVDMCDVVGDIMCPAMYACTDAKPACMGGMCELSGVMPPPPFDF